MLLRIIIIIREGPQHSLTEVAQEKKKKIFTVQIKLHTRSSIFTSIRLGHQNTQIRIQYI